MIVDKTVVRVASLLSKRSALAYVVAENPDRQIRGNIGTGNVVEAIGPNLPGSVGKSSQPDDANQT